MVFEDQQTTTYGRGAYTIGTLTFANANSTPLYIFIGGAGKSQVRRSTASELAGGYNGGGKGVVDTNNDDASGSGGGATDIRTVSGAWNNFSSLKSRIMVAGGGGGSSLSPHKIETESINANLGTHGGAPNVSGYITCYDESTWTPVVNQTSGYAFGYGQDGNSALHTSGGGGGGYYGGRYHPYASVAQVTNNGPASGGSSFISGHTGCNAIAESSTSNNITHTGQPNHYSGYVFTNTSMSRGVREGNGFARITLTRL